MLRRLVLASLLPLVAACGSPPAGSHATASSEVDVHSGGPAAATPEALVAVALSHLTPDPDRIELHTRDDAIDDVGTKSPYIGGMLSWNPDPDWYLDLRVQPSKATAGCPADALPNCAEYDGATLTWQDANEDAPAGMTLVVVRDGERRSVATEAYGDGDPRKDYHLPASLHELASIVTDPAFALRTTQGAVDAGKDVRKLVTKQG